jgi:hypothetical protein
MKISTDFLKETGASRDLIDGIKNSYVTFCERADRSAVHLWRRANACTWSLDRLRTELNLALDPTLSRELYRNLYRTNAAETRTLAAKERKDHKNNTQQECAWMKTMPLQICHASIALTALTRNTAASAAPVRKALTSRTAARPM